MNKSKSIFVTALCAIMLAVILVGLYMLKLRAYMIIVGEKRRVNMYDDARGGRCLHGRELRTARFHAPNSPKNTMHAKQVERRSIIRPVRRTKFL